MSDMTPVEVEVHEPFRTDTSKWEAPEDKPDAYKTIQATVPHQFRIGDVVMMPKYLADQFKKAGWVADVGQDPLPIDREKPVLLKPQNGTLSQSAQ